VQGLGMLNPWGNSSSFGLSILTVNFVSQENVCYLLGRLLPPAAEGEL